MGLNDLEVYWKHWVLEESEGKPFKFYADKGKGREREEEEEEEEADQDQEIPAAPSPGLAFDIDQGISLPCQCDAPGTKTTCLEQLAMKENSTGKTFYALVQQVDALEVSSI